MTKAEPQPLDGTVSDWLKPLLRVVKIEPAPTEDELQRWLDRFYPEIEAAGHAESAHLGSDQARRRVGWAKTKQIAVIRWRHYLTRTPRELRLPPPDPVLAEIDERLSDWKPEAGAPSLSDLGFTVRRH